jgi:pheromone shutdown-related protein TraB
MTPGPTEPVFLPRPVPGSGPAGPLVYESRHGPAAEVPPLQVELPSVLLVGTAHVSKASVDEVKAAIETWRPDVVAVELDARRYEAITKREQWEKTPVHRLLNGDKLYLFLAQTMLASYQRRLGHEFGSEPGAEMVAAIRAGEERGLPVEMIDRDVGVTFKRAFGKMGFFEKWRITWELVKSVMGMDEKEGEKVDLQKLMDQDVLSVMMNELGETAPSIKTVLIDERDQWLAEKIRGLRADGKRVLAVLGAGHVAGVSRLLEANEPIALEPLAALPTKKVRWGKIVGWGLMLLVFALFGYFAWVGVQEGNWKQLRSALLQFVLITGGCAAAGALLARGHPYSIATAFAVAPMTTLHPALAAGWFAGAVEAWVREPTVKDFQGLRTLETMKDFFRNGLIRVLMVAAITNIGAIIGFYWAVGRLADIFFGG